MNDLRGKYVNVVLTVQEGTRMNFLKQLVYISATFNGKVVESDLAEPEENPQFNTELTWVSEKKDLRKIRSDNIPLRVECYTMDHCQRKEKIGFVLLSMRNAKIVPIADAEKEIPYHWYRLLGVPNEFKSHHPELLISLSIRDRNLYTPEGVTSVSLTKSAENLGNFDFMQQGCTDSENQVINIKYLKDGFIQIGEDESCNKHYLLNIVLKTAYNMDLLLPEIVVFGKQKDKFYISFSIFDNTIKSKSFSKDLHDTIVLNDRIVIRLKSKLELLHLFFEQYNHVELGFYCGTTKLGMTILNLLELVPRVSDEEFAQMNNKYVSSMEDCVFALETKKEVPEGGNGRKPHVSIETYLEIYEDIEKSSSKTEMLASQKSSIVNMTTGLRADSGDQGSCIEMPSLTNFIIQKQKLKSASVNNLQETQYPTNIKAKSMSILTPIISSNPDLPILSPTLNKLDDVHEKYQQYVLEIILDKITWQTQFNTKNFIVKFRHPKASTEIPIHCEIDNFINEEIDFVDTSCNMYFFSTKSNINEVLYAWPPKMSLLDGNGCCLSKEYDLQTSIFQDAEKNEANYMVAVKKPSADANVAYLRISMRLREYGLEETPEKPGYQLLPIILDERIALKHLQELEQWKEEQKNLFAEDLTDIEKRHIGKLEKQWKDRKETKEKQLENGVQKCKTMSAQLKKLADALQKQKKKLQTVPKFERDSSIRYSDSYETLMNKYGSKYETLDRTGLLEVIVCIEEDNVKMKQKTLDLEEELESIRQAALTKEQTANLLQQLKGLEEKFYQAQTAKSYFKDQWKKAVREIHTLKSEDQKQIQSQIKNNLEELSQLSLDSFFNCNSQCSNNPYSFESVSFISDTNTSRFNSGQYEFEYPHVNFI